MARSEARRGAPRIHNVKSSQTTISHGAGADMENAANSTLRQVSSDRSNSYETWLRMVIDTTYLANPNPIAARLICAR
jgi:hypothetical protein